MDEIDTLVDTKESETLESEISTEFTEEEELNQNMSEVELLEEQKHRECFDQERNTIRCFSPIRVYSVGS